MFGNGQTAFSSAADNSRPGPIPAPDSARGMTMSPVSDAKLTYGIWGIALGAGIAMTIGFGWGGWTTSGTTAKMAQEAVVANQASICVAQFMKSPNHATKVKEFQGTESYNRSDFIEKDGWDKMPGQDKADWGVSRACVAGIEALVKTGA